MVPKYKFVTIHVRNAYDEIEQWEVDGEFGGGLYYKKELGVCSKHIRASGRVTVRERRRKLIKEAGATHDDLDFWSKNYDKHGEFSCVLPKNHSGKCHHQYKQFFQNKGMQLKVSDPINNPGNNGVYMNRAGARNSEIMLDPEIEKRLDKDKYKGIAIRPCFGSTRFGIATGVIDIAALMLLIEGIDDHLNDIPNDVLDMLKRHGEYLIKYWLSYSRTITNEQGNLVSPGGGKIIRPEHFTIEDRNDDNRIEFGHGENVNDSRFMTRGHNVLLISRRDNTVIGSNSLKTNDVVEDLERITKHLRLAERNKKYDNN